MILRICQPTTGRCVVQLVCIAVVLIGSSGCGKSSANLGARLDAGLGDGQMDGSSIDAPITDMSDAEITASSMADVDLTFTGCAATFDGELVVLQSMSSVSVTSRSGRFLTGSIDLLLDGQSGELALSSRHRLETGVIINLIISTLEARGTWTNMSTDADVLAGLVRDPIGGTLRVHAYDRVSAMMDLTFDGVTLQKHSAEGTVCRIDGRLRTFGPSFE